MPDATPDAGITTVTCWHGSVSIQGSISWVVGCWAWLVVVVVGMSSLGAWLRAIGREGLLDWKQLGEGKWLGEVTVRLGAIGERASERAIGEGERQPGKPSGEKERFRGSDYGELRRRATESKDEEHLKPEPERRQPPRPGHA